MDYWHQAARSLGAECYDGARGLVEAGRVTLVDVDTQEQQTSVDAVVRDPTRRGDEVQVVSCVVEPARRLLNAYCSWSGRPDAST